MPELQRTASPHTALLGCHVGSSGLQPWTDALAGPWGGPLPRQLCSFLLESTGRFELFPY